jgi:hypothetical protein
MEWSFLPIQYLPVQPERYFFGSPYTGQTSVLSLMPLWQRGQLASRHRTYSVFVGSLPVNKSRI